MAAVSGKNAFSDNGIRSSPARAPIGGTRAEGGTGSAELPILPPARPVAGDRIANTRGADRIRNRTDGT